MHTAVVTPEHSPEVVLATLASEAGVAPTATRYQPGEVARILGVTRATVRRLVHAGRLHETRVTPARVHYLRTDVVAYLASLQPAASSAPANL